MIRPSLPILNYCLLTFEGHRLDPVKISTLHSNINKYLACKAGLAALSDNNWSHFILILYPGLDFDIIYNMSYANCFQKRVVSISVLRKIQMKVGIWNECIRNSISYMVCKNGSTCTWPVISWYFGLTLTLPKCNQIACKIIKSNAFVSLWKLILRSIYLHNY
jgi:hypothetical protein